MQFRLNKRYSHPNKIYVNKLNLFVILIVGSMTDGDGCLMVVSLIADDAKLNIYDYECFQISRHLFAYFYKIHVRIHLDETICVVVVYCVFQDSERGSFIFLKQFLIVILIVYNHYT